MELHRRHRQVGVKNYGGAGRQCSGAIDERIKGFGRLWLV